MIKVRFINGKEKSYKTFDDVFSLPIEKQLEIRSINCSRNNIKEIPKEIKKLNKPMLF